MNSDINVEKETKECKELCLDVSSVGHVLKVDFRRQSSSRFSFLR